MGIFAVMGLAMAWSMFCRGRPGLVSALFTPLLGKRVTGAADGAIDVFSVIATLFGTTTSLGLGALQINGGLTALFGVPSATWVQFLVIVAEVAVALWRDLSREPDAAPAPEAVEPPVVAESPREVVPTS